MNLDKIKKLSENKNITLTDLAGKINMSYQNLNRCIREKKIQATDLENIANVLDVPISYFFDEVGPGATVQKNFGNNNNVVQSGGRVNIVSNNEAALLKEIENLKSQLSECKKDKENLFELLKSKKD